LARDKIRLRHVEDEANVVRPENSGLKSGAALLGVDEGADPPSPITHVVVDGPAARPERAL
jgi:hypothetical protein